MRAERLAGPGDPGRAARHPAPMRGRGRRLWAGLRQCVAFALVTPVAAFAVWPVPADAHPIMMPATHAAQALAATAGPARELEAVVAGAPPATLHSVRSADVPPPADRLQRPIGCCGTTAVDALAGAGRWSDHRAPAETISQSAGAHCAGTPALTGPLRSAGLLLTAGNPADQTAWAGWRERLQAALPQGVSVQGVLAHLPLAALLVASSLTTALMALLLTHLVLRRRSRRAVLVAATQPAPAEDAVLLFEGSALVEASDGGRALMRALPEGDGAWPRFSAWAEARFPGFTDRLALLSNDGALEIPAAPPLRLRLMAQWCHGMIRVALHDPDAEGRTIPVDRLSLAAAEAELAHLRRMLDAAPLPVWREAPDGTVVWANPAYMRLACSGDGRVEALRWPLPRLFDLAPPAEAPAGPQRIGLEQDGPDNKSWFDCTTLPGAEGQSISYALPADATVRAEAALQDVVQTLSRTFAHLPVGLAVFDSQRRLQIFNPALGDLTTLPVDFLISRPGFEAFFDALRSRKMIPEPRDYRAWRKGLTEIERAAASGHYQEVWSLSGGQTYRVTGRPHPDGAVAFLIEDVSAEVSLTRRFRAEIETGQAVVDTLPEALAVFSPVGVLVMSNTAYADLWGVAPDTLVGEIGVAEALGLWKAACHPGPHWAQLRTLIGAGGPRRTWEGAIHLRDGRHMLCRLVPLQGGSTMVAFRPATEGALPARPADPSPEAVDAADGPRRATGGP